MGWLPWSRKTTPHDSVTREYFGSSMPPRLPEGGDVEVASQPDDTVPAVTRGAVIPAYPSLLLWQEHQRIISPLQVTSEGAAPKTFSLEDTWNATRWNTLAQTMATIRHSMEQTPPDLLIMMSEGWKTPIGCHITLTHLLEGMAVSTDIPLSPPVHYRIRGASHWGQSLARYLNNKTLPTSGVENPFWKPDYSTALVLAQLQQYGNVPTILMSLPTQAHRPTHTDFDALKLAGNGLDQFLRETGLSTMVLVIESPLTPSVSLASQASSPHSFSSSRPLAQWLEQLMDVSPPDGPTHSSEPVASILHYGLDTLTKGTYFTPAPFHQELSA